MAYALTIPDQPVPPGSVGELHREGKHISVLVVAGASLTPYSARCPETHGGQADITYRLKWLRWVAEILGYPRGGQCWADPGAEENALRDWIYCHHRRIPQGHAAAIS
jgi:hypothetical protein